MKTDLAAWSLVAGITLHICLHCFTAFKSCYVVLWWNKEYQTVTDARPTIKVIKVVFILSLLL